MSPQGVSRSNMHLIGGAYERAFLDETRAKRSYRRVKECQEKGDEVERGRCGFRHKLSSMPEDIQALPG
jgi:hypothetical protein